MTLFKALAARGVMVRGVNAGNDQYSLLTETSNNRTVVIYPDLAGVLWGKPSKECPTTIRCLGLRRGFFHGRAQHYHDASERYIFTLS